MSRHNKMHFIVSGHCFLLRYGKVVKWILSLSVCSKQQTDKLTSAKNVDKSGFFTV